MAKAQRVWGTSESNQRPLLKSGEEEVIGIYNMLSPGEGRITAVDIFAVCDRVGIVDAIRMVELVKVVEGEILLVQSEEREKKMKKNG